MPSTRAGPRSAPFALAALSGGLYWAAYPPHALWPLAFLCWVPLLLALRGHSPRRAFFLGWLQGVVANAAGFVWLPAVVRTFGSLSWAACVALAALVWAYNALAVATASWLFARASRNGWPAGAAFVLALAGAEACVPLLVPTYAAAQVHRVPLLMQLAELGGMVLVGVPLAMANVGVAELAAARLERRPVRWRGVALAAAGPALAMLFGAWRMAAVDARVAGAPAARVLVVQGNTSHAGVTLHDSVETYRTATARAARDAAEAPDGGPVDLVVWPETAIASVFGSRELETSLRDYVARTPDGETWLTAPVLSGTMLRHDAKVTTNAAVLFDARGALLGQYDKVHPLVIGEYLPFDARFPQLGRWLPNAGHLSAGAVDQPPLVLSGHRIAALICYEDLLPGFVNALASRGDPELLVNLTNDSWFGDSAAARVHYALAQFRAVEHRRFLVRASNSGVSGFVDPVGRSWGETPLLQATTRVGEVRWLSGATVYERLGDRPWWAVAALMVAAAFVRRPGARRAEQAEQTDSGGS